MARRKLDVSVNGNSLLKVDDRIILRAVRDEPPQMQITYGDAPFADGQWLLARRRQNRHVTIEFAVRELYSLQQRRDVVDAANAWAKDGHLRSLNRYGQYLRAVAVSYASIQDPRDYNETFKIEYEAPYCPYWMDNDETTLELSGTSKSGTLKVPGNAQTVVEATIKPTGGTLQTLTLTVDGASIKLEALALAKGNTLTLDHNTYNNLRIMAGSAGRLSKRTADSADDLFADPGDTAVSFTANTACTVTFRTRGRYR